MTLQLFVAHATKVAVLAALAGLLLRGKAGQCWSFVVYLVAILLGNTLATVWPARFLTPSFWMLKQAVYDALKMAVALELAWRVFAVFPGAWHTARRVLSIMMVASTLAIASLLPRAEYANFYDWQPRVTTAAIWLITATALIVVRYEVPIREWQRAIMLGFAPYLLVFVTYMGLLKQFGWSYRKPLSAAESAAFLTLMLFWVYSAWRVEVPASQALSDDLARAA